MVLNAYDEEPEEDAVNPETGVDGGEQPEQQEGMEQQSSQQTENTINKKLNKMMERFKEKGCLKNVSSRTFKTNPF